MRIRVSRAIRSIEFSEAVKRRLTERIRESVERIREAETQMARLEPKLRHKVSDEYKRAARKLIHDQKGLLTDTQAGVGTRPEQLRRTLRTVAEGEHQPEQAKNA